MVLNDCYALFIALQREILTNSFWHIMMSHIHPDLATCHANLPLGQGGDKMRLAGPTTKRVCRTLLPSSRKVFFRPVI